MKLAISRIREYTELSEQEFMQDTRTQDAVIRNFEILGEAVKGLSKDLRARHPNVPWREVAAMRDFLIHVYFGVSLERVWQTIKSDLDKLEAIVTAELKTD
ncbi:MAG: DUF86 domain-containing protein [Fimbriimonadales bacterium]